jgi:putative DNA primase/helicase
MRFPWSMIPDPEAWLIARAGPLVSYAAQPAAALTKVASDVDTARTLSDLSQRLTSSMADILRARRVALDALSLRLAAHNPTEITNFENGE